MNGAALISSHNTRVLSLSLKIFYLSCALALPEAAAGVTTQFTISVAGFADTQEVAVASSSYMPPGSVAGITSQITFGV